MGIGMDMADKWQTIAENMSERRVTGRLRSEGAGGASRRTGHEVLELQKGVAK